jgi:hypothetical protein|tara:strand:+ start:2827 stop:3285 length:459 start_codon:yes stop_codon:yes gene_type:complete
MAEQKTKDTVKTSVSTNGEEEVKFEPIKQIETDTFDAVKGIKTFDYVIIALLAYLVFILVPDIQEKVEWLEKDLNSVLVQSERYKAATRVMSKGNVCAECHLNPDHLITGLQSTYPSFADLKGFMSVGHQKYFTMPSPMADTELMEIYRTLK